MGAPPTGRPGVDSGSNQQASVSTLHSMERMTWSYSATKRWLKSALVASAPNTAGRYCIDVMRGNSTTAERSAGVCTPEPHSVMRSHR